MEYIIKAHSPSTNQTQREINLESPPADTERLAWMMAESFATRLNTTSATKDWLAQIELVDTAYYARTL
jgi:hypothetical protein